MLPARNDSLQVRIDAVRIELLAGIDTVRTELQASINAVRTETQADIARALAIAVSVIVAAITLQSPSPFGASRNTRALRCDRELHRPSPNAPAISPMPNT